MNDLFDPKYFDNLAAMCLAANERPQVTRDVLEAMKRCEDHALEAKLKIWGDNHGN